MPPVPGVDLKAYYRLIASASPIRTWAIRSRALPGRFQPAAEIHPPLDPGPPEGRRDVTGLALESALWCRYCAATTDAGDLSSSTIRDASRLTSAARAAKDDLRLSGFARHLRRYRRCAAIPIPDFEIALNCLWRDGYSRHSASDCDRAQSLTHKEQRL